MNHLVGKRLAVISNVHRVHDGRTYYRQAHFAAERGMRVSILAIDDGFESKDVEVESYSAPKSRFRRFILGWWLTYRAFRQRADIYHFHDPEMLLPMTFLGVLTRKPIIYDCHENVIDSIYYKPYIPKILRPYLARIAHIVQWTCVKLLGTVVVATPEQLEMFPASVRHLVIRNFPPKFTQQVEVNASKSRPFDLVHCGAFSEERGSRVILETLRLLVHNYGQVSCRLLLVGIEQNQLTQELKEFITTHRLKDNIEFRGYVPLHAVSQVLSQAKIGLMCHQRTKQYRYGVASKLFDYMASGLAIVGGQADFDRQYAPEETVKIYVDETKPKEYAEAICRLMDKVQVREQMGLNAQQLYIDKYTAEDESEKLIHLYEEILDAKTA